MKTKTEILRWLRANKQPLGGLTSHDVEALVTSVNLSNLISYASAPPKLFEAYYSIVMEMQPTQRGLAYHAIASELDWGHREMIWTLACLPEGDKPKTRCFAEP